jgi:membrane protease YdiL (CAAX protease family)
MKVESLSGQQSGLFRYMVFLELGLVFLALLQAYFGFFDHQQPLGSIEISDLQRGVLWGTVFTLPMLLLMGMVSVAPFQWALDLRNFVDSELRPLFAGMSIMQLAVIAVLAGLGEELLFRWSIQGGITTLLESFGGLAAAQWTGLLVASILFGLCHAMTISYLVLSLLAGLFLGWVMIYTGSWLVPAFAHALYDFLVLIYLARFPRGSQGLST